MLKSIEIKLNIHIKCLWSGDFAGNFLLPFTLDYLVRTVYTVFQ